jgi:Tol biopolymer transport system component
MISPGRQSMFHRRKRSSPITLILIGAIGLVSLIALFSPRVLAAAPPREAVQVPALVPVSLTFSQAMDAVSVESRLSIQPATEGRYTWDGSTIQFQPFEPWPAGTEVTVNLQPGSRSRGFLPLLSGYSFSFNIGSPRIAYLWPDDRQADIYAITLDGSEVSRITHTEGGVIDFSISASRANLAYSEMQPEGGTNLILFNLADGNEQELYSCEGPEQCSRVVLSPEGSMLAFERTTPSEQDPVEAQGSREVWILDLETKDAYRISPQDHEASNPAWSLINDLAYYNHTLQAAAVVDPRLGAEEALLRLIPATVDSRLEWQPDGSGLLFPQLFFEEGRYVMVGVDNIPVFHSHLFYHDIRGNLTIDLSGDRDGLVEDSNPVYDPSGQWIAFTRKYLEPDRWTLGRQIWVMAADASEKRNLINDPDYQHASLVWSPDSTRMVYTRFNQSDLFDPVEIWMVDLDSGNNELLVRGGYAPQWIP